MFLICLLLMLLSAGQEVKYKFAILRSIIKSKTMKDFIHDAYPQCLVCAGHSEGQCYCQSLQQQSAPVHSSQEFISIESSEDNPSQIKWINFDSISQFEHISSESLNLPQVELMDLESLEENLPKNYNQTLNQNPLQTPIQTQPTQPTSPQKRTDNHDHKPFAVKMKSIYNKICGKFDQNIYKKFYHRKDFILRIWILIEASGNLDQAFALFKETLEKIKQEVPINLIQSQLELKQHERKIFLIESHLTAFAYFLNGDIEKSMKAIYDYENMRQKPKFWKAFNETVAFRQSYGFQI